MITFAEIRKSEAIAAYIAKGDQVLGALGYTEHSEIHSVKVAVTAAKLLSDLGYSEREIELAKIAGYMHDIGNSVNRVDHAHTGAVMAFGILSEIGMAPDEIACVISAIGNHDEGTGSAFDPISAALIIADKTDVRRNRVRNTDFATFDIHDRVNYAAVSSKLLVNTEERTITLDIDLDAQMCTMLDYFEIFLKRMLMCRRAAEMLGMRFRLTCGGHKIV